MGCQTAGLDAKPFASPGRVLGEFALPARVMGRVRKACSDFQSRELPFWSPAVYQNPLPFQPPWFSLSFSVEAREQQSSFSTSGPETGDIRTQKWIQSQSYPWWRPSSRPYLPANLCCRVYGTSFELVSQHVRKLIARPWM